MSLSLKTTAAAQERDLSILTERQRMAYLFRRQKMTYKKIGEAMGISTNAASDLIHHAERRFREYMTGITKKGGVITFWSSFP